VRQKSLKALKDKVRSKTIRSRGDSLERIVDDLNPLLRGWINYFRLTETKGVLEELDSWMRRRLRCLA